MDGEVVCWPACPLAEGAPGGLWVIPGFLTPNQRFARALDTIQAGIRHPPPAPGQTFDHQGTRVYWPCGDDVERMSRLFPGCQPDAIPWDRVKAELVAAPPALVESRDWSLVPAAALLILVERLRRDLAADDAASRGVTSGGVGAPRRSTVDWNERCRGAYDEWQTARENFEGRGKTPTLKDAWDWLVANGELESTKGLGFDSWKKARKEGETRFGDVGKDAALDRGHSVVTSAQIEYSGPVRTD